MPSAERARAPTAKSSILTLTPRCVHRNPRQKENSRNLVVCIDGTSNQFGQNNTNVVKLFAQIDLETNDPGQHAYYSSGIGTRPKSLRTIDRIEKAFTDKFDMAIAWNLEEIVKDAYGWLARTYREGDRIYLFGFSRGAYQVRVLAGMIHEVGLIRTTTDKQIGAAYDHYEAIRSKSPKTRQIAREFKNTFSWPNLRVHFIGVWDTVSSVGLIRGDVFLSTSSSAAHACHFRHALALDERRVKFMPEYFHEMNSQVDDVRFKYVDTSLDNGRATASSSEQRNPAASDSGTSFSEDEKNVTPDIKEVWFAGSHSDVGGTNEPGRCYEAGNASLLWMRREATEKGLALLPTDIVWVPDDIDRGISDSMKFVWRVVERIPVKHQVSFAGAGEDARRPHRLQPRRIIPGQKVHASILFANAYKPQATLGDGFDIPITYAEHEDTVLDDQFWETGLFDNTAAQKLVNSLSGTQAVAPVFLDRLLFMLRFKEGKERVRSVTDWDSTFKTVIEDEGCAPLVRLVTMVAYYEASSDPKAHSQSHVHALPHGKPSQEAFGDAEKCLHDILTEHKHRDGPRVVALLKPLTKHQDLRDHILTERVLNTLVNLLDKVVGKGEGDFGRAMEGLRSLLQCENTRETIIKKLAEPFPSSNLSKHARFNVCRLLHSSVSRLSQILKVNDPPQLIAALRMVLVLAKIQDGSTRDMCSKVKSRIRELAVKGERLVGLLAVEVLLALYDDNEPQLKQLNIHKTNVRANLASALVRMNFDIERHDSVEGQGSRDPRQGILHQIFGFDAERLDERHKRFIRELKTSVKKGTLERTAATMTLLNLCKSPIICDYLREINLSDVFVDQLRDKGRALLAAYALAVCLGYDGMKESIRQNEHLSRNIVRMLQLNYFDDAIGQVEGFQIFGNIMRDDNIREKITEWYKITDVLERKLAKGEPKEIRTSMICLDIIRSFGGFGADELVEKSLLRLRSPEWKIQKAGVTILSALSQTDHGAQAIEPRIRDIIRILLPRDYDYPIFTSRNEVQLQRTAATIQATHPRSLTFEDTTPSRPPSWMLGPACALRNLSQIETLREFTRRTSEYGSLKHLYLSGTLVGKEDTWPWQIDTPNRADVTQMLDKMIKAVDGELSEENLLSIGDSVLPHIRHWNRLLALLGKVAFWMITFVPGVMGISALVTLAAAVGTPVYLLYQGYRLVPWLWSSYLDSRLLDAPHDHSGSEQDRGVHVGNTVEVLVGT